MEQKETTDGNRNTPSNDGADVPTEHLVCDWVPASFSGCRKRSAAKGVRSLFSVFGTLSVTFRSLFLTLLSLFSPLFCQTPFAGLLLRQGDLSWCIYRLLLEHMQLFWHLGLPSRLEKQRSPHLQTKEPTLGQQGSICPSLVGMPQHVHCQFRCTPNRSCSNTRLLEGLLEGSLKEVLLRKVLRRRLARLLVWTRVLRTEASQSMTPFACALVQAHSGFNGFCQHL